MDNSVEKQMLAPLQGDEIYLRLQLDMVEALVAKMPLSDIKLSALAELIARSARQDYEITRGPHITDIHHPQFPGDEAWVRVVAVGRPLR